MAQYYRDSEKLFIAYQYSLDNFRDGARLMKPYGASS